MKRIFIIIFMVFITNFPVFGKDSIYSDEYLQKFQNSFIRKERFNAIYYNALQMTPEQIDKYEDMTEFENNLYKNKMDEIVHEVKKYQIMKECNLPYYELKSQRQLIKKLYRQIKKISDKENRLSKKILTREQRGIYNMIKHLEWHDLKKTSKDYYKLNPKMQVFGNLKE